MEITKEEALIIHLHLMNIISDAPLGKSPSSFMSNLVNKLSDYLTKD